MNRSWDRNKKWKSPFKSNGGCSVGNFFCHSLGPKLLKYCYRKQGESLNVIAGLLFKGWKWRLSYFLCSHFSKLFKFQLVSQILSPAILYLNTTGSRHSHGNWSGQVDVPVLIITLVSIAVFVCCVLPLCWYFCGEGKKLEYRRPVVYDTHCDDECHWCLQFYNKPFSGIFIIFREHTCGFASLSLPNKMKIWIYFDF